MPAKKNLKGVELCANFVTLARIMIFLLLYGYDKKIVYDSRMKTKKNLDFKSVSDFSIFVPKLWCSLRKVFT